MPKQPRGDFSESTKRVISGNYNHRCAICLQKPTKRGRQCAHLFDNAGAGALQVQVAIYLGVVQHGYRRSSAENGMIQCPTCHQGFFTPDLIALSPPPQILKYIVKYLRETDAADLKPLHEVFRLFDDAVQGIDVDLPDMQSILPFLGLFTLVTLSPDELSGSEIPVHHQPDLSMLDDSQFISAPADTLPDAPGVARIFDVLAISDDLPKAYYSIPLSPKHSEFTHQRYWRIPAKPEVVLMMLMDRIMRVPESGCEEISYARVIYCILHLNKSGVHEIRLPNGKKRTSEDRNDDEPPHKFSRGGDVIVPKSRPKRKAVAARILPSSPRPGPRPRKTRPIKI